MKFCLPMVILTLLIAACKSESNPNREPAPLTPITLAQAYPGDILKVDRIELLDGSSGDRRSITDKQTIREWIREIKDIVLQPDENQEGRVGYVFGIELYEGQEVKLGFIPTSINKISYKPNDQLDASVRTFFEKQFGKDF